MFNLSLSIHTLRMMIRINRDNQSDREVKESRADLSGEMSTRPFRSARVVFISFFSALGTKRRSSENNDRLHGGSLYDRRLDST